MKTVGKMVRQNILYQNYMKINTMYTDITACVLTKLPVLEVTKVIAVTPKKSNET